jgi:hypothetical protein
MKLKILISICYFYSFNYIHAQTWQSIHKNQFGNTTPWNQFVINPYTNDIWMVNENKAAVIQNDGSIQQFTSVELGQLWNGSHLQFAFTPNDIYYAINLYGLFKFTGFTSVNVNSALPDYLNLQSNADTIFVTTGYPNGFIKYTQGNSEVFNRFYLKINARNNFFYGHDGSSMIYQYDQQSNSQTNLTSDPNYLQGIFHDTKFSRFSDTLYIGGRKGISYAYNYDILDTITPNNTSNMPSPNVLELEFDHLDQLWAVFGDTTDTPFAIAKLEGSTWTNFIDATNSPIDFSNFLGLEIDTLGNLWVADNLYLHTLMTATSPGWLGTTSLDPQSNLAILPNPAQNTFCISGGLNDGEIEIIDLQGRKVLSSASGTDIDISQLNTGQYFVVIEQKTNKQVLVLIKE